MSDTPKRVCGNCAHWEKEAQYRFGDCLAPVSAAYEYTGGTVFPEDKRATDCPCFRPPGSDSREVLEWAIALMNDAAVDLFDKAYELYRRGNVSAEVRDELIDLCMTAEGAFTQARAELAKESELQC